MEGEVVRDDQWERLKPFVLGGRKGRRGHAATDGGSSMRSCGWPAPVRVGATCPKIASVRIKRSNDVITAGSIKASSTGYSKRWLPIRIWNGCPSMPP